MKAKTPKPKKLPNYELWTGEMIKDLISLYFHADNSISKIQEVLSTKYDLPDLSYQNIYNKIASYKAKNADILKQIQQEKKEQLSFLLDADNEILNDLLFSLQQEADVLKKSQNTRDRLQVIDRMLKVIEQRRKISGFIFPEQKEQTNSADDAIKKLNELLENAKTRSI